jgi:hypothetical protein
VVQPAAGQRTRAVTLPPGAVSAVLVPVPDAEPAVASYRLRFDPSAARGVPAHVTVLFPFLPLSQLTSASVARLADAVGSVRRFGVTLSEPRWFEDGGVLYLAPVPAEPFQRLTAAVSATFPECPPYEGRYADVVPHLTIGHPPLGSRSQLEEVERDIGRHLPVRSVVDRVWLMAGTDAPDSWRVLHELPLG